MTLFDVGDATIERYITTFGTLTNEGAKTSVLGGMKDKVKYRKLLSNCF